MIRETSVQFQVKSYQRLKKWYLMPPYLILSIIRYGSRVKWSNPGNRVAPSPTPWCGSYRKGSLRVTLDYCQQLFLYKDIILSNIEIKIFGLWKMNFLFFLTIHIDIILENFLNSQFLLKILKNLWQRGLSSNVL